jgi:pimeloyl-ACP methyl ester carboxylesterase
MRSSPPARAPRTVHGGTVSLGDLKIHQQCGGAGKPVVFIHGIGSSGYIEWRFNLEAAASTHRVFAPDLPGFGRSDKPRATRYGIPYFAKFIDGYMESLGLGTAAVVATSMGGRIALELVLNHPHRVSKLVLVNSLGLGRPSVHMSYGLITIPRVGEMVMHGVRTALNRVPASMIRRVAGRYVGATSDLKVTMDDEYLADLKEMHAADGFGAAYLATLRSIVNPRALRSAEYDITARLPAIKVPVQLIWGADDPLFPLSHATRAHGMIPDCRLAVIEGAGHTPQAERPEEFNRVLASFLS